MRQYWHRPRARARTARDSSSGTVIAAACLKFAMPHLVQAKAARSIPPGLPILPVRTAAKAPRCYGPSTVADDDPLWLGIEGFQLLPPKPMERLWLNSCYHGKSQRGRRQWVKKPPSFAA